MKALVIDNEKQVRESVIELIRAFCPEITVIEACDGIRSGIEKLKQFQPDVLFLDVELDDGTGMDFLSSFNQPLSFPVVFITAYNKYAVDAFRYSAVDFLLKPINPEELMRSVEKAKTSIAAKDMSLQLQVLRQYLNPAASAEKKIVLKDNDSIYLIKVKEIIRCESEGSYTTFFLDSGDRIVISKTIKEFDELLEPFGFIRPHQSHLVNKERIKRFNKTNGGEIVLDNNDLVPVSQRKRDQVLELLKNS
ncbi:MAG TPA: LytTR family DNA-binding domain-containing protein [Bacteroidia bacterium]